MSRLTTVALLGFSFTVTASANQYPQGCVDDVSNCPDAPSCNLCACGSDTRKLWFTYTSGGSAEYEGNTNSGRNAVTIGSSVISGASGIRSISCDCPVSTVSSDGQTVMLQGSSSTGHLNNKLITCLVTGHDNNVQYVQIDTNCDCPMVIGHRWGALTLSRFKLSNGFSNDLCPSAPRCELCCSRAPEASSFGSAIQRVPKEVCDSSLAFTPGGTAAMALTAFINGAGCDCRTRNPNGNAVIVPKDPNTGATLDLTAVQTALCSSADYCPEISVRFECQETCTPSSGTTLTQQNAVQNAVVMGTKRFEVGYESASECPSSGPYYVHPCPLCCALPPRAHAPHPIRIPKTSVCDGTTSGLAQLDLPTQRRLVDWFNGFNGQTQNSPAEPAIVTLTLIDSSGTRTSVSTVDDVVPALCAPNPPTPNSCCHEIQVEMTVCDPCRPVSTGSKPALCQTVTSTFSITDNHVPVINSGACRHAECAALGETTDLNGLITVTSPASPLSQMFVSNLGRGVIAEHPTATFEQDMLVYGSPDNAIGETCMDLNSPMPRVDVGNPLNAAAAFYRGAITESLTTMNGEYCQRNLSTTYTCVDECGNTATTTKTWSITDSTAPAFRSQPTDLTLSCEGGDLIWADSEIASWASNFIGTNPASDTCWGTSVNYNRIEGTWSTSRCLPQKEVTFTATDECGLEGTSQMATIQITDLVPPTIPTCSGSTQHTPCVEQAVECQGGPIQSDDSQLDAFIANNGGLTCSDTCGTVSWDTPFIASDIRRDSCARDVVIKFVCRDECGNVAEAWGHFNVSDSNPPFSVESLLDETAECTSREAGLGSDEENAELSAWVARYSGVIHWADDACQANDPCYQPDTGNVSTIAQTRTDYSSCSCADTYDPVCVNGVEYINSCHAALNGHQYYTPGCCAPPPPPPPAYPGTSSTYPSNNDGCSASCSSYGSAPVCCSGETYENFCYAYCAGSFYYTDGACNSSIANPAYPTYPTTTAPCISYCEAEYISEVCGSDGNTYATSCHATCAGITSYSDGGCYQSYCAQAFLDYNVLGFVTTYEDLLGNPVDETGATCVINQTYTFEASDGCGHTHTDTATFQFVDTTAPVIGQPALDVDVECADSSSPQSQALIAQRFGTWIANMGGAISTCSDSCQSSCTWLLPTYTDTGAVVNSTDLLGRPVTPVLTQDPDGCQEVAHVTFTATDECGNTAQTSASFYVIDQTAPEFHLTSRVDECAATYPNDLFTDFGVQQIGGDCNGFLPSPPAFVNFTCPSIYEHYIADVPSYIRGVPPVALSDFEWHRLQNEFPDHLEDVSRFEPKCPFITIATVEVQDSCNNTRSENATHIYQDTTPPRFSTLPQNLTIECMDQVNASKTLHELTAWLNNGAGGRCADECGAFPLDVMPTYNPNAVAQLSGQCPQSLTVEFTCTDFCGNNYSQNATFAVADTTPPRLSHGCDPVTSCESDHANGLQLWLDDFASITACDNCTEACDLTRTHTTPVFTPARPGTTCTAGTNTVTFTVADECGNDVNVTKTFTVLDENAPHTTGGRHLTYPCNRACTDCEATAQAVMTRWVNDRNGCLSASDCQAVTWANTGIPGGNLCGTHGSITYTSTDACGNEKVDVLNYNFPIVGHPPPPPVVCDCCEACGGTPRALIFRWDASPGNEGAHVSIIDSGNLGWRNNKPIVSDGESFTLNARNVQGGFHAITAIGIAGYTLGSTVDVQTIRTACDSPLLVGTTLTYTTGTLTLVNFKNNQGQTAQYLCPAAPAPPAVSCPSAHEINVCRADGCVDAGVRGVPENVCASGSAPKQLVFEYVGGGPSTVSQPGASVSGATIGADSVTISCERQPSDRLTTQQTVRKGETYSVSGGARGGVGTYIQCTIRSNEGAYAQYQIVELFTDCSQPLSTGDRFGALRLASFTNIDDTSCVNPYHSTECEAETITSPAYPGNSPSAYPGNTGSYPSNENCRIYRHMPVEYLTFKYVGGTSLTNTQNGQASVSGLSSFGSPPSVHIVCDATMVCAGSRCGQGSSDSVAVMLDGHFRVTATSSPMTCTIRRNDISSYVTQEITLVTDGSESLVVNDVFGSLQVVGYRAETGRCDPGSGTCNGELSPNLATTSGYQTWEEWALAHAISFDGTTDVSTNDGTPGLSLDTPSSPPPPPPCEGTGLCTGTAIPTSLTFEYTGGIHYTTTQPLDGSVRLFPNAATRQNNPYVPINVNNEKIKLTPHDYDLGVMRLRQGARFTIRASAPSIGRTFLPQAVNIMVGRTRIKLVMNCKTGYNLNIGDEWGPLKLVGFSNTDGDACEMPETAAAVDTGRKAPGTDATGASNIAVVGLVAGVALTVILVVGVFRLSKWHSESIRLNDDSRSTVASSVGMSEIENEQDLQWDAHVVSTMSPKKKGERLRPRLTTDVE